MSDSTVNPYVFKGEAPEQDYYLLANSLFESKPLYRKPPIYVAVWMYLLHRNKLSNLMELNKEQLDSLVDEMKQECSWKNEKGKRIYPAKVAIQEALGWFRIPSVYEELCGLAQKNDEEGK